MVNLADVEFILEDVWGSRSALSKSIGLTDRLTLVRWDKEKPATFGNIICLTKKEAKIHANLDKSQWNETYSSNFLEFVESRFEIEAKYLKWRDVLIL